ncbi:MAG TPA: cytochrome c [Caulifigura sp.]|jgi:mono/diheme cytochrome c family protein|nr:cytochrome c [Caulifigura sp.]
MCAACSKNWPAKTARVLVWIAAVLFACRYAAANDSPSASPDHPGWRILKGRPFLPPDFDQATFDQLPLNWPAAEREALSGQTPLERRKSIAAHYGLTQNPWAKSDEFDLLGYVKTEAGWVMNCLACHGGTLEGKPYPGLGNNRYALQTLTEDVRRTKLLSLKKPGHLDLAILKLPLNTTNGTSNSVIFGVILGAKRLPDMSVDQSRPVPKLVHHDMDAPPWWHLAKKSRLYADDFSPKTHRAVMQFMLLPENDRDTVLGWEDDFRQILDWMHTVKPPQYDGPVDAALAEKGRAVFNDHCARCHGTYGENPTYPELVVPIDEVGTDRVRFDALSPEHRQWMKNGWMSRFGEDHVETNPAGYVAPPLDGVWASAPYFHNGSVPTLWHVLHPDQRPAIWRRTGDKLDRERMGLAIEAVQAVPTSAPQAEQGWYFDTTKPSKSAAGHLFVNDLTEAEKQSVLEYLKTL